MAIFELDADRAVAVQAMEPAPGAVGAQVERIIEERLGAILGERLLTVARGRAGHDEPFLLSLDGFGGVVVSEIVTNLDAATLASAIVRAGHASRLGDAELAQRYHRGPQAFVSDRAQLFTAVPEVQGGERRPGGSRLVVVCAAVALDALDALEFLRQPGSRVEVLRVGVLRGTDGRRVLDVSPLGLSGRGPRGLEPTGETHAPQVTRRSVVDVQAPVDHEAERRRLAAMVSTQALPVVTDPQVDHQQPYEHLPAPAAAYPAGPTSSGAPAGYPTRVAPATERPAPSTSLSAYAGRPAAIGSPYAAEAPARASSHGRTVQQPSAYATRPAAPAHVGHHVNVEHHEPVEGHHRTEEPRRTAAVVRPGSPRPEVTPHHEPVAPHREPVTPARSAIGVTQTPTHATAHPRPYQPSGAPETTGATAHPAGYAGARYRARLASVEEVSIDTNPNDLSSLRDSSRSFAAAMAYTDAAPVSRSALESVDTPALAEPEPVYADLEPEPEPEPEPVYAEPSHPAQAYREPVSRAPMTVVTAAPRTTTYEHTYVEPARAGTPARVAAPAAQAMTHVPAQAATYTPAEPTPYAPAQAAPQRRATSPKGPRDPALAVLAARLDGPAPLVWVRHRRGETIHATLHTDGVVELADGQCFWSADLAACAAVGASGVDGWRQWRLGDETGPTLAECR